MARLQRNAREPQKNLAADLTISEPTLSKKITRLLDEKVIRRQTVEIDLSRVGLGLSAITLVKERSQSDAASTQALLCAFPEAYQVHKISGDWDYVVMWNCEDSERLDAALVSVVDHPNVEKIQTFVFMRTLKRESNASIDTLLGLNRLAERT